MVRRSIEEDDDKVHHGSNNPNSALDAVDHEAISLIQLGPSDVLHDEDEEVKHTTSNNSTCDPYSDGQSIGMQNSYSLDGSEIGGSNENDPDILIDVMDVGLDTADEKQDECNHYVEAEAHPVTLAADTGFDSNNDSRLITSPCCNSSNHHRGNRRRRAEYIYVKINKPTPDTPAGLLLRGTEERGKIFLKHIIPDGLLGKSKAPLEPGDRVVAVNGYSTKHMLPYDFAVAMLTSQHSISILVRNKATGIPNTVCSVVQKPSQESPIGISMRFDFGALLVSIVERHGIFNESLLIPGDRIIEINGHPCLALTTHPEELRSIVASSPDYVRIIVERNASGLATVLCALEDERLNRLAAEARTKALHKNKRQLSRSISMYQRFFCRR